MDCRVLGRFEVLGPDGWQCLSALKRRRVLAALVMSAGEIVAADRIADAIWGEEVPSSAPKVVQNHVMWLRRILGNGVIITSSITNEAVDELKLKAGDSVVAIIKASDVMVAK